MSPHDRAVGLARQFLADQSVAEQYGKSPTDVTHYDQPGGSSWWMVTFKTKAPVVPCPRTIPPCTDYRTVMVSEDFKQVNWEPRE